MGRIKIKMVLHEFTRWGKERLDLAQNRDRWLSLVNAETDCTFYKICHISSLSEERLAFQNGIRSMEIVSQSVSYLVS